MTVPPYPPAADLVPPLTVADALRTLADGLRESDTVLVAVDDDPTGAQTVRDVPIVTSWEVEDLEWGLRTADRGLLFVLTNSRSMGEADARRTATEVATALAQASRNTGIGVRLLSRSDSTLRGHYPVETDALAKGWWTATGHQIDAVVLCPAYLEAGRVTVDGVHLVRVGGRWVPAGQTEFARDATFGYQASDLPGWAAERSHGAVSADDVILVDLKTIRNSGVAGVIALLTERLGDAGPSAVIALDAVDDHDLEIAALALAHLEGSGRRFLYRTGPTFVRVRAGMPRADPVVVHPAAQDTPAGVLVVVGSHTELTTRQVAALAADRELVRLTLDVPAILNDANLVAADVAATAADNLARGADVLVETSRSLHRGHDGEDSLRIARTVSDAVVDVVRRVLERRTPRAIVAKGGITSNEVATKGLGVRRARVLGSLLPGLVSLWQPLDAEGRSDGPTYTVFPGNVGDDDALRDVVRRLTTPQRPNSSAL